MRDITLLILDVDGVLTDGGIIMDEKGKELKCFSVRDGTAAVLWNRAGFKMALISGRMSKVVEHRAKQMRVCSVHQNAPRKLKIYKEIKKKYNLKDREIAYVGDDLHDIPIMKRVGLSIAVADASRDVLPFVQMITSSPGGRGAVREVIELMLKAKGVWGKVTKMYYE